MVELETIRAGHGGGGEAVPVVFQLPKDSVDTVGCGPDVLRPVQGARKVDTKVYNVICKLDRKTI